MSVDVQAEVVIARPREVVAGFMFDPKSDRLWMTGFSKVFPMQSGPLVKGAKVERIGAFLNRQFSAVYFVTDAEEGKFVEMTTDEPFEMKFRYELADEGEGATRVRLRIQSFGELRYSLPIPMFKKAVDEKLTEEAKRLKKRLEEGD
ncbi:MAG: SRPBCC family protein [Acidobacteria bacterium]|nr:SRPBCC family protein [Acidobacteriota bacterium]MBK8149166.1 SRPBCC family protein [Acidobacteriota bacterium]MBK8811257.1 SRPBCC family protein [Acidobacteriota bacterium]